MKDKKIRRVCKCGKIAYPRVRDVDVSEPWICEPCNDRQILQENQTILRVGGTEK